MATEPNAAATLDPNAGLQGNDADLPVEGSQPQVEGQEPTEPTEPQVDSEGKPVEGETKEDGRVIPQWMRALKESNPEAYKKAKTDLFDLRTRQQVHPTVQAAREEHDLVQSLGGKAGIDEMRENATFFRDAANQFLKGDPAFIKDLWEEDAIAAALHVQPMLEAFKASDREGYNATVCRLWDAEFTATGLPNGIKLLIDAISGGKKDDALAIANELKQWQESVSGLARKADDPRVKTLLAERAKQRDNQQQTEQQEFLKSYRTEAINSVVGDVEKVFDSFFKGRKMDPEDRQDLLREALAYANRKVEADKDFAAQRDKHLERGDSHSALQLTKSRFARELPDAVKRIARRYGMVSGQPSQSNQRQPNNQGQGNQPRPPQGYVAVNQRPSPEDISPTTTREDILTHKRAILKDGRKVTWAHLK